MAALEILVDNRTRLAKGDCGWHDMRNFFILRIGDSETVVFASGDSMEHVRIRGYYLSIAFTDSG